MNQIEIISEYIRLSEEIDSLENSLSQKERELSNKYSTDYARIKSEIGGYISKIKPTVEAVCSLYKGRVQLSNNKIYLPSGAPEQKFTPVEACEMAIRMGNEGIKLLSAVISKNNVDVNLREFAIRYNTIVQIYTNADRLQNMAVSACLEQYKNEIAALKKERQMLCGDDNGFNELVKHVKENSRALSNKVIINDKMAMEKDFVTKITLPLGYEASSQSSLCEGEDNGVILSLLEWSLHNDGVMVIKAEKEDIDSQKLSTCITNTVVQFLFSYPATNKRVLLCDSTSSNTITTFAGILKEGNTGLFFDNANGSFVKNSDEEIRSSLNELNRIINQRIMVLGQSRCKSVLEYNSKNQDNPLPIILAVLNGYPFKFENACDHIESVLKNGKNAGVFFLITENTYEDEESKYYRKRLPSLEAFTENIAEFKILKGEGYLCRNGKSYHSDTCGDNYSLSSLLGVFKVSVKDDTGKTVYLDSVVGKEDFATSPRRKKYSKTISIPFGKQGSNPISLDLSADGTLAHLALIGVSGSGKTAFINSLVLSASKLYSPSELEFHLIIMVKGDFKIFEEQRLPHLKTVVTGDKIFAANDILDFIDDEMKRRSNLIGSYGNIYSYNEVADEPLSRCVIIIDEFYQLVKGSDDAVERITEIAQVGRAYGISLVLSSINFPAEVSSIIPQFGNRIEFKAKENAGQLIPQAATRQGELEGAKGLCFYARGDNLHSVRVAYAEEGDRLKEHIEEVKSKYPQYEMELKSEIKPFRISNEADVPFSTKRAKRAYDEEGIVRARLGKTYLSNRGLEYNFEAKNNCLFLYGRYLDTKMMEASLIKDIFVLSSDIDEPTVYYIDYNKSISLKRAKTVIKSLRDSWVLSGKMVYSGNDEAESTLEEIKDLIDTREEDEECSIHPVLVVITKADDIFNDDDMCELVTELISRGKESNIFFVIQCDEPVSFYGSDKYVNNAIIFPDRTSEEPDSSSLCRALEAMPVGATQKARKLIANASITPLNPMLHILCNNNRMSIFVPYEYDEGYLKSIIE